LEGGIMGYYSTCHECGQEMHVGDTIYILYECAIIEDTDTIQEKKQKCLCPDCAGNPQKMKGLNFEG